MTIEKNDHQMYLVTHQKYCSFTDRLLWLIEPLLSLLVPSLTGLILIFLVTTALAQTSATVKGTDGGSPVNGRYVPSNPPSRPSGTTGYSGSSTKQSSVPDYSAVNRSLLNLQSKLTQEAMQQERERYEAQERSYYSQSEPKNLGESSDNCAAAQQYVASFQQQLRQAEAYCRSISVNNNPNCEKSQTFRNIVREAQEKAAQFCSGSGSGSGESMTRRDNNPRAKHNSSKSSSSDDLNPWANSGSGSSGKSSAGENSAINNAHNHSSQTAGGFSNSDDLNPWANSGSDSGTGSFSRNATRHGNSNTPTQKRKYGGSPGGDDNGSASAGTNPWVTSAQNDQDHGGGYTRKTETNNKQDGNTEGYGSDGNDNQLLGKPAKSAQKNKGTPVGEHGDCLVETKLEPKLISSTKEHCYRQNEFGSCRDLQYRVEFRNQCSAEIRVFWRWNDKFSKGESGTNLRPGKSYITTSEKMFAESTGEISYRSEWY